MTLDAARRAVAELPPFRGTTGGELSFSNSKAHAYDLVELAPLWTTCGDRLQPESNEHGHSRRPVSAGCGPVPYGDLRNYREHGRRHYI